MGGPLPLGYDLKDGKLVIVEEEAERVRLIFRQYLEVCGINELARDLEANKYLHQGQNAQYHGRLRGRPSVWKGRPLRLPAQPILHWRGHLQERGVARGTAGHYGQEPV